MANKNVYLISEQALVDAIDELIHNCDADNLADIAQHVLGGEICSIGNEEYNLAVDETYGGAFYGQKDIRGKSIHRLNNDDF